MRRLRLDSLSISNCTQNVTKLKFWINLYQLIWFKNLSTEHKKYQLKRLKEEFQFSFCIYSSSVKTFKCWFSYFVSNWILICFFLYLLNSTGRTVYSHHYKWLKCFIKLVHLLWHTYTVQRSWPLSCVGSKNNSYITA